MARGVRCLTAQKDTKKCLFQARREADSILATGANRLLLIEAILIVCVFVVLFTSLQSATAFLLMATVPNDTVASLLFWAASLVFLVLGILFAAPVILGLFRLVEQMQAGEDPVLLDLFYFLSSRERYRQSLHITRTASRKIATAVIVGSGIDFAWSILVPDAFLFNTLYGMLMTIIIILCTVWLLFPYGKLYSLLKNQNKPLCQCGGIRFVFFFFPWILLGFISVGLLLVLDVIPRMLLTYFCDCKQQESTIS